MEHYERSPRGRGASDKPQVLLAGFAIEEAASISSTLEEMGWTSTCLVKATEIEAAFSTSRFDVTVIDTEHLEVFAPQLIANLRSTEGSSSVATILAIDNSAFAGFKEQLTQAGADLIVPKPSDPRLYLVNFTQAATYRLQNTRKKHA